MVKRLATRVVIDLMGTNWKQTVERAELISSHQDNDPNWPGFYGSNESIIDQKFYSQKTVDACFEDKLSKLAEIFEDVEIAGVEIAGAFSHGDQMKAITQKIVFIIMPIPILPLHFRS